MRDCHEFRSLIRASRKIENTLRYVRADFQYDAVSSASTDVNDASDNTEGSYSLKVLHDKGKFNNVLNIPLNAGTTSEEYLNAYENVLTKIKQFKPEFLLFSAGFDAHIDDPLAQIRLGTEDFYKITKRTLEYSKSFCNGKVVSILEGGYDLKALQSSSQRHVDALLEFN